MDYAVGLEEDGPLDLERRRPSQGLVEGLCSSVALNAEGHEAYALFHLPDPS